MKYNREKWDKIVSGLKKVSDIRQMREGKFIMDRLMTDKIISLQEAKVVCRKHMSVIKSPAAGLKRRVIVSNEEADQSAAENAKKLLEDPQRQSEDLFDDEDPMPKMVTIKSRPGTEDESEDEEMESETTAKQGPNKKKVLEADMDVDDEDDDDSDDDEEGSESNDSDDDGEDDSDSDE